MKKILFSLTFAGFLFLTPALSVLGQSSIAATDQAKLMAELQEKIKALQAQIAGLKTQLEEVKTELRLTKTLRRGSRGDEVKKLQEFLKQDPDIYPEGLVTGYYGPITERAVKRFQEKHANEVLRPYGLKEGTGVVGERTLQRVNELAAEKKITICHVPEGDPANRQTITIGESAVNAHLIHGDGVGECPLVRPEPPAVPAPSPTTVPATTSPEIAEASLYGACVLRDAYTNLPGLYDSGLGAGYAKRNIGEVTDYNAAKQLCTTDIYNSLLSIYCFSNKNPAQRQVATYNYPAGGPATTGCGPQGCDFISCPSSGEPLAPAPPSATTTPVTTPTTPSATTTYPLADAGSTDDVYGACVYRNIYTSLPGYNSFDSGTGYAKQKLGLVSNYSAASGMCTESIYNSLWQNYCSSNPSYLAQREVATYGLDGLIKTTGCSQYGCGYTSCNDSEIMSSQTSTYGACVVRKGSVNAPAYGDPDLGTGTSAGYAKQKLGQVSGYSSAYGMCTNAIYESLMRSYCSVPANTGFPAQWQVHSYGFSSQTGCSQNGCDYVTCDAYTSSSGSTPPPSSTASSTPVITLGASSLNFSGTAGSADPASQSVFVTNGGGGTLSWSASDNTSWLNVSPPSGTGTGTLTVSVSSSGLVSGVYTGTITISATDAQNSPQTIAVTFTISPAPPPPPPLATLNCSGVNTSITLEDDPSPGSNITWNPDYGTEPSSVATHRAWFNSKGLDATGNVKGFIWTTKHSGIAQTGVVLGYASPTHVNEDEGLDLGEVLTLSFLNGVLAKSVELDLTTIPSSSSVVNNVNSTVILSAWDSSGYVIATSSKSFFGVTNGTYTPSKICVAAANHQISKVTVQATANPYGGVYIETISMDK